jgi:tripartite-type tricarboxylate transporter receptor subunit TctC
MMKETAIKKISIAIIVLTALIAGAFYMGGQGISGAPTTSFDSEDPTAVFFNKAVINWIIPNNPGGGYDEYARLISPFFEKYTGARLRLFNLPGSGGTRALSELSRSPADGLTIGLVNGIGMVTNQIAGTGNSSYRIEELSFLGRVVDDVRVLTVSAQSEYTSFTDIMNAQRPVRIGATGFGDSTYVEAVISRKLFDLNVTVIRGFNNSSAMRQAMLRGDLDGAWSPLGSVRDEVNSGQIRIVLQVDERRNEALPEVPTVLEFLDQTPDPLLSRDILKTWIALNTVGRVVVAPPGLTAERLRFLREAFRLALNDPDFLKEAEKSGRTVDFASGKEMEEIVKNALLTPIGIQNFFAGAMRSEL